eukprot:TRINITY_DN3911_c0_g1_i1.p2 TRINITY_DN3911_c0_g1~~TRINITY_DN3911_c0_g1_i1.p2  ORF type:complete len:110 (+),score=54.81 TRINITY_DN3911_c0_g1_i1:16-345(+)
MARKNNKQKRAKRLAVLLGQEKQEEKKTEEKRERRAQKRKREDVDAEPVVDKKFLTFGEENLGKKGKERMDTDENEGKEVVLHKEDDRGGKRRRTGNESFKKLTGVRAK